MVGSINKVILVGNLGADPRVNTTQNGSKVVTLSVATSDTWKDKLSGERKERTEWHRVVVFNAQLADVAERYLRKGSKVYIEGQLQTRKWEDANGQEKYTTEVVLQNFSSNLIMLEQMCFPVRLPLLPAGIPHRQRAVLPISTTTSRFSRFFLQSKRPRFDGAFFVYCVR